jgi:DegV family protein with EDD domain
LWITKVRRLPVSNGSWGAILMKVKIITDSTSDLSPELAKNLGIEVVPGYVRFDGEIYRDGVDISKSGFYRKLADSPFHPVTAEASPQDFAQVYSRYAYEADGILSIHISSKISRMYQSAQKGKKMVKAKCPIEVIDSHFASIGLALIVIAAARLASAGESIENITGATKKTIGQINMLGFFDTMKYIARGGRASQHVMELSNILRIKPLLTFKNGEITVEGLVRTHAHGLEELYKFVEETPGIQDLGIAYSTDDDSALALRQRLGSVFPEPRVHIEQIGAALGAHCGPGAVFVAIRRGD